jgi:RimJ/RimL family protein N-acetyltransferase
MTKVTHTDIYHLGEYAQHLKALPQEDKYSRFGYSATDYNIDQLILSMIYHPHEHELWFIEDNGVRVGWGHMAKYGDKWELALSVVKEHQRKGYGNALIAEMLDWAKFTEIHEVYMNCIEDNRAVQHLAAKNNLKQKFRGDGERTSAIEVPEPTIFETNAHIFREQAEIVAEIGTLRQRLADLWNPFIQKS